MIRKWIIRLAFVALASVALIAGYAALLCFPEAFFAHAVRANNLTLYSDRELPEAAAQNVLKLSHEKLARSPLYAGQPQVSALICNERWRERLFFNKDYGVGGVAYPFSTKVFLRRAAVEENRLISPRGVHVPGVRTLDFFVTHEMMHALTGQAIGSLRYNRLPQWIREGYPDYIAWGGTFDYAQSRKAFLEGQREMDPARSGLYWRFTLLVAHMLDRKHWSVDRLLAEPFPDQKQVEQEIRSEE